MKKRLLIATSLTCLMLSPLNGTNFAYKHKPADNLVTGTLGVTGLVGSAFGSWIFVNCLNDNNQIGACISPLFIGAGLTLVGIALHEHSKLIKWNQRSDEEVYNDVQGTYTQALKELEKVYAVTGNNGDTNEQLKQNNPALIKKLKALKSWNMFPLVNLVNNLDSCYVLLNEHAETLANRITTHTTKNKDYKAPEEWSTILAKLAKEQKTIAAIEGFIVNSRRYKVERFIKDVLSRTSVRRLRAYPQIK
ncbi:hypothetical protein H0X48_05575 [Candidatus Dependentiae bacterium]|nr:hypothetical protein [Candidatus Dependentiae bacterium]